MPCETRVRDVGALGHDLRMDITFLQPDGLVRSPAFSHAVVIPAGATTVYIGGQNGVDASGAVGLVVLDTTVTEELEAEGWARDLVRLVQDERKAAGLHVGDRIRLELRVPQDKDAWTGAHLDLIKREVGCVDASVVADPAVKEPTATVEKVAEVRKN